MWKSDHQMRSMVAETLELVSSHGARTREKPGATRRNRHHHQLRHTRVVSHSAQSQVDYSMHIVSSLSVLAIVADDREWKAVDCVDDGPHQFIICMNEWMIKVERERGGQGSTRNVVQQVYVKRRDSASSHLISPDLLTYLPSKYSHRQTASQPYSHTGHTDTEPKIMMMMMMKIT